MMPKAARARVASPPAGTALARAAWECLRGRARHRARFESVCNRKRDKCQCSSDEIFPSPLAEEGFISPLACMAPQFGIMFPNIFAAPIVEGRTAPWSMDDTAVIPPGG